VGPGYGERQLEDEPSQTGRQLAMNAVRDNEILATYSRHYKGRAGTEPHAYLGVLQPNAGSALTLALFASLWREQ